MQGSQSFVQSLIAHDLVDAYRLMILPVIPGFGRKLFAGVSAPGGLTLTKSGTSATGVVMVGYERAALKPMGSFALPEQPACAAPGAVPERVLMKSKPRFRYPQIVWTGIEDIARGALKKATRRPCPFANSRGQPLETIALKICPRVDTCFGAPYVPATVGSSGQGCRGYSARMSFLTSA